MDQPKSTREQAAAVVQAALETDIASAMASAAKEARERVQQLEDRMRVPPQDLSQQITL